MAAQNERTFKVDINMSLITTARLTIACLYELHRVSCIAVHNIYYTMKTVCV